MPRAKIVIIAVLISAASLLAGGYAGWAAGRAYFGSEWLNEQAGDIEDRVALLQQLRTGVGTEALEALESRLDADLIAVAVDDYIAAPTVAHLRRALQSTRRYRERFPRRTGHAFIDDNVARRLAGELRD